MSKLFRDDLGVEYIDAEDGSEPLALGLSPETEPVVGRSLSSFMELPSLQEMRKQVESSDWQFGREHFDGSWTMSQGNIGKCASSAAVYALEKARYLRGQRKIGLSCDYLYSLVNGGSDRGSTLSANMRAISNRGVATDSLVPHGKIYPRMYDRRKADKEALRFRAHESFLTPGEQEVCAALCAKIPVVIAIHVGRNWRRFDNDGVLIGDSGPGNHSEHLDDIRYSRSKGRFEFRKHSSHGKSYGEDGYCWIHYGHLRVHSSHAKYAVPSAIDDPLGENPFQDSIIDDENEPDQTATLVFYAGSEFDGPCRWCDKFKQEAMPVLQREGVNVIPGDVPGGGRPRFTLRVAGQEESWQGYKHDAQEILRKIADMKARALAWS